MEVSYYPPAQFDAKVTIQEGQRHVQIEPKFFTPAGPSSLGHLVSMDSGGKVLDRAILSVNGHGRIMLSHRREEVTPVVESEKSSASKGATGTPGEGL